MAVDIHPSAIVDPKAVLGEDVLIEAFAIVGPMAKIGDNSVLRHHCTVDGDVELGANNEIYPYAMIGGLTHDLKYEGGVPKLKIGSNNVFREYVTAHVATNENDSTLIGSDNVFLAYSHVAHDCVVGNNLVMSSHSALGGHVEVHDHVNVGWGAGVHQFCKIGRHAMVSACSKLVQDVPPFMLADGSPAEVRSINKVGMERHGFPPESIEEVRKIFKTLYKSNLNRSQAIEKLKEVGDLEENPLVREFSDFVANSDRGLA
jgi:UDP-N-acetylglucosamine acyltransferase